MKDDAILAGLRDAAKRRDEAKTGTPLDAPLGESFEAKAAARILAEQRAAGVATREAPVSPRRSFGLAPGASLAFAGFAMAAAIALFALHPWSPRPSVDALPAYAMLSAGGEDSVRGDAPRAPEAIAAPIVIRADAPLTLLLRPALDVTGKLDVTVYASRDGAPLHAVTPAIRVSETGAVEVRGRAGDLVGDAPGEASLVVVVAREGAERPSERARIAGDAPRGVTIARAVVRVHD